MIVRVVDTKKTFQRDISDPQDEMVQKFRKVVGAIANKAGGRLVGFEMIGGRIRMTFAKKDVADKVAATLKEHKVEVTEIDFVNEFFDELETANSAS